MYSYSYQTGNILFEGVDNMKKNQLIKMMSIAGMSLLSLGMLTGCGTQTNNAVASA